MKKPFTLSLAVIIAFLAAFALPIASSGALASPEVVTTQTPLASGDPIMPPPLPPPPPQG